MLGGYGCRAQEAEVVDLSDALSGHTNHMNINSTKFRLAAGQYVQEKTPKDLIVLHYTAGTTVNGAFQ